MNIGNGCFIHFPKGFPLQRARWRCAAAFFEAGGEPADGDAARIQSDFGGFAQAAGQFQRCLLRPGFLKAVMDGNAIHLPELPLKVGNRRAALLRQPGQCRSAGI